MASRNMARLIALCATTAILSNGPADANSNIESGSTYQSTNLGSSVNPDFKGGTLQLNSSAAITDNFTVEDYPGNTIDSDGNAVTMSGAFTGAGPMTFTDSAGGGSVTLTNSGNTYTGVTTINPGATLLLSGVGTISTSSGVVDNGTFDISGTTTGASVISLSGAGTVNLGNQSLAVTDGADTFSGIISGTGGLVISGGTETLANANSYTGGTTITKGTLVVGDGATDGSIVGNVSDNGTLEFNRADSISFGGTISGAGAVTQLSSGTLTFSAVNSYTGVTTISAGGTLALASGAGIASSSEVVANGTLDISATSGTSVNSLSGTGTVQLGGQTLTIMAGANSPTDTSGNFSGVIEGSGGVTLNGGTELLSGANTYTGPTVINGGTLELGASAITYNIADGATLAFDSANAIAMSGVVSGTGGVTQIGTGATTVSTVQAYTGPTTITAGTLALSGSGNSIATSSGVTDNGTFDVSAATSAAQITSLAGTGTVKLGSQSMIFTNASGTFSGAISGTGSLTLAGGTETLSGANTYTGATIITAGTLSVTGTNTLATSSTVSDNAVLDVSGVVSNLYPATTTITSLNGSGSVVLGSSVLNFTGANGTFSGTISGTGGVTINAGNEILAGANTYTGTTTITAGTLALSSTGSLATASSVADNGVFDISATTSGMVTLASLSGSGTVNLGSQNLALANASGTFSGSISGTGGLVIIGGTETLTGTNSYTGGTTIAAGTLQIGNSISNGALVGNIADYGTLAFDPTGSASFAGAITGSGNVTQNGAGTTILTGTSSYTGGTTISSGTLQIGNGGTSGSITGTVADNGTLAFARSDTTTFVGPISGTGGVTLVSGTTIFTALNSYSGVTTIDSLGDLILSSSGGIASSSSVTDNGTFDISATSGSPQITGLAGAGNVHLGGQSLTLTNAGGTFSGAISGSGGVTLANGAQTLSGSSSYSGGTTVAGGTLTVTGSIASSSGVTVDAAGTLAGTGTLPSVSVNSGGTISPGVAGVGTLHVNGTVAFASGSDMAVQTTSGAVSALAVSGAEPLGGTLSVTSADGTYDLGQKMTVLTAADGVSGTFTLAPIENTGAVFTPKLSYDANDVYLQINLAQLSPLLASSATPNETAPVKGIDAAIAAGENPSSAIENLGNLTSAGLTADADQLSGEIGSDLFQAGQSLFDPFLETIFDHIADGQPAGAVSRRAARPDDDVWVSGFGGTDIVTGQTASVGSHELRSNLAGVTLGGNWTMSPSFMLGAAFSAGTSHFHLASDLGSGKADAFQGGVYGLIQFLPRLYGSFAGALALDKMSTDRTVTISGTDVLTGNFNGLLFGGRYEMGAQFDWITPYIAITDEMFHAPSYSESASSGTDNFALNYASHFANDPNAELGMRQQVNLVMPGWTLKLSDRFAWVRDMAGTPDARASLAGLPDSSFLVDGARFARNAGLLSMGADIKYKSGFGLYTHFDSKIAPNLQSYTGMAGMDFSW